MKDFKKITIDSYDKSIDNYIKNTNEIHQSNEMKKFIFYILENQDSKIKIEDAGFSGNSSIKDTLSIRLVGSHLDNNLLILDC